MNITRKFCLGLAVATLPLPVYALDLTPDPSRVLSDPTYLPMQAQVYGSTDYSFAARHAEVDDSTGANKYDLSAHTQDIGQTFAYGVTNDFSLHAHMDYDPAARTQHDLAGGGTNDYESHGFGDPSFGATYRMVDPTQEMPVNWDVMASYSPDLLSAKNATTTDDGNIARGGQQATIGTALGYKMHDLTLEGVAGATWNGHLKSSNATTDADAETSPFWGYYFGVNTQTRLTQLLSLDLGARYDINQNRDGINGTGLAHTNDPGNITQLSTALNFQVVPNRLVASLDYAYQIYSNSSNTFPTVPASDTSTKDQHANIFGADLQYVF